MNEFKKLHPLVNFLYFFAVIGFAMVFMHPICLAVSFVCAILNQALAIGRKSVKFNLLYMLPAFILAALITPTFSHEGVTILAYLPSGNPLTLESIFYGVSSSVMLITVITWFSSFNTVITSDKIIYLSGRIMPSMSLILSMCLRFVPRYKAQIKKISLARKGIGADNAQDGVIRRIKNGLSVLSAMVTWSLENAIETADSMKCRGYGLQNRSAYSNYRFTPRDFFWILWIFIFSAYVIFGKICGIIDFSYYPHIKSTPSTPLSASIFTAYFLLCITPVIIETKEALQWKALKSKI